MSFLSTHCSKYFSLLCFLVGISFLTACQNANTAFSDLQDLADELENFSPDYDTPTWKESIEEYKSVLLNLQKYNYSAKDLHEIQDINKSCIQYYQQYHQIPYLRKTLMPLYHQKSKQQQAVLPVLP